MDSSSWKSCLWRTVQAPPFPDIPHSNCPCPAGSIHSPFPSIGHRPFVLLSLSDQNAVPAHARLEDAHPFCHHNFTSLIVYHGIIENSIVLQNLNPIQTEEKQNALRGEPQTSHFLYQTGISALCFDYTGRKKEALFLYRRKKSLILIATAQRCSISLIFQNLVNLFFFID